MRKLIPLSMMIFLILSNFGTASLLKNNNSTFETLTIDNEQQFEIKFYGSIRVRDIETPWNQKEGIYAEAKNLGPDNAFINVEWELKATSTVPYYVIDSMDNMEIPVDSIINIGIFGGNFGFGIITFTVTINGCGEDDDYHYEKTAYGICCGGLIFVLFQK